MISTFVDGEAEEVVADGGVEARVEVAERAGRGGGGGEVCGEEKGEGGGNGDVGVGVAAVGVDVED